MDNRDERGSGIPCIAHQPIRLGTPHFSGESLRRYLSGLNDAARRLGNAKARLLVHLPIELGADEDRVDLKRKLKEHETRALRITVLPALSDHVPPDELIFWLESYDLDPTRIVPAALDQPYDDLLEQIRERYALEDD